MDIRISLDGAAGMLLLSLPWLLLAAAAWRAAKVDRSARGPGRESLPARAGHAPGAKTSALQADEGAANGVMSVATLIPDAGGGSAEAHPAPVRSRQQEEEALVNALSAAKAERNDVAMSRNSILLARLLLERSARAEAATLLQSAAMIARRAKLPVVHAEARIELAEMARADGDMTSACEHWQMAKLMFHESGRRADRDRMADVMRQHNCPTDWVLTNF